jgi:hypothetical protein
MNSSEWTIASENVIFEVICESVEYFALFAFTRFEWVSYSTMQQLFDIANSQEIIPPLSTGIAPSAHRRCIFPVSPT